MAKRNYTHIKELVPTIQAMVAEGMTQREIAEHFGFKDKFVVKFAFGIYMTTASWHTRQQHNRPSILFWIRSGWQ